MTIKAINTEGTTGAPKALSFWQMWNLSFGFLGVQFGFALQNGNASRILSDLGADLHTLSLFWLVAPITGLIVQPIVGAASDRCWTPIGRRGPFILAGAIAAALGMMLMPNAAMLTQLLVPIAVGAMMLALMDAAFNVTMQPFRALVSDMLPSAQRNQGYAVQALLINVGAVLGSLLPFLLTNVLGMDNRGGQGKVADSVIWSFYIGAGVLLLTVFWTLLTHREPAPGEGNFAHSKNDLQPAQGLKATPVLKDLEKQPFLARWRELIINLPPVIKQLAWVQFFSWFALFIMWVYCTSAIAQHVWGVESRWFNPSFLASLEEVPKNIFKAKGQAGDWVGILFAAYALFGALFSLVLAPIADRLGRKHTYAVCLFLGGISLIGFIFCDQPQLVAIPLIAKDFFVPLGALYLLIAMLGIGIAWSAILALPYAILSDALPENKTGTYMGIFNFTIALPQIVSGLFAGLLLKYIFNNQAIYIMVFAGIAMCFAGFMVFRVKDIQGRVRE